jgi:hypothetical protein
MGALLAPDLFILIALAIIVALGIGFWKLAHH